MSSRACDRCGFAPETVFLRRLSILDYDARMTTLRLCPDCYRWAEQLLSELIGDAAVA
jgi:hypothetical protein